MMVLWCLIMRWNHYLMGWGWWPLEALDGFWLMFSMRSHIHAWNIAQGQITEERFSWATLWSGGMWKSHLGFRFCIINGRLFLLVFYEHFYGLYVVWVYIHEYFYFYYFGYICVLWRQLCNDFTIFLLVIEWSMYLWTNAWNGSWCVEESIVLSDSKLCMRPLCSELLFTPVNYIFVMCLTKWLSCLVGVQSRSSTSIFLYYNHFHTILLF